MQFKAHMDLCFYTLGSKEERYNLRQLDSCRCGGGVRSSRIAYRRVPEV